MTLKPGGVKHHHDEQSQEDVQDFGDGDDEQNFVVCDPLLVFNVPVKSQKSIDLCPADVEIERQSYRKCDDGTYFAE